MQNSQPNISKPNSVQIQHIESPILWSSGIIPGMQGWFNKHKLNPPHYRMKEKSYDYLDVEIACDKMQHPFMIKTLQ